MAWYAGRVKNEIEYLGSRDCSPGGGLRFPVNKARKCRMRSRYAHYAVHIRSQDSTAIDGQRVPNVTHSVARNRLEMLSVIGPKAGSLHPYSL